MSGHAVEASPGWYGKLPAIGDFASRRLPPEFIHPWDEWLQGSLAESRAHMGERWLDAYLNAPIWRFAITPGTLGPTAWAGVLMSSVDSVGRYFPLTIAASLEPASIHVLAILAAHDWFARLEQIALSALEATLSPDAIENELQSVAFQPMPSNLTDAERLVQWLNAPRPEALQLAFDSLPALDALWLASGAKALTCTSADRTVWWCNPIEGSLAPMRCFTGLPPKSAFCAMLEA